MTIMNSHQKKKLIILSTLALLGAPNSQSCYPVFKHFHATIVHRMGKLLEVSGANFSPAL